MKALVTGITGLIGSHLSDHLLSENIEVAGIVRKGGNLGNISHIKNRIALMEGDMNNPSAIKKIIAEAAPDYIFHLAANVFIPDSWKDPAKTMETNVNGTIHLLEAVRLSKTNPRILIAGSSEEYGMVYPDELPVKETNQLRPLSPYGVSKAAQDLLGWQYFKSYGMNIVRTRAFSHTGPRMREEYATSSFAKQIAEIEKGLKDPIIYVGNLSAKRDYLDARDIVKAYHIAMDKCRFGEAYNICSEKAVTMKFVLDTLLTKTEKKIEVKVDPKRLRPSEVEVLVGDCSKFKKETGWEPKISLESSMKDVLEYWREKKMIVG